MNLLEHAASEFTVDYRLIDPETLNPDIASDPLLYEPITMEALVYEIVRAKKISRYIVDDVVTLGATLDILA